MYTLIIFSLLIFLPLPLMASVARKTKNCYKAIFGGVIGVAVALMVLFVIASFTGNPIGQAIASDLQLFSQTAASSNQVITMFRMEDISFEERVNTLTEVYTYAINALPATMLVWATIIAYLEYMLISRMSKNAKYPLPQLGKVKDFSMPKKALWGWILIYLMTFIVVMLDFAGSNVLQINIQVLFQFAFQIQGIAAIFYFCYYKKLPKPVAIISSIAFFFTAIGQMILCVVGFLDLGFGLRKKITKR